MRIFVHLVLFFWLVVSPGSILLAAQPALVLQITIDQLRGDMLDRNAGRFGPSGFRHLLENGAVFRNANFRYAGTVTAAGHATLATGGNPQDHGIVSNEWFDAARGEARYCVEDDEWPLLGEPAMAREGRSPASLRSSTLADQVVLAGRGKSRAFAVSVKDRAAILTAGKSGKAFWYSKRSGAFVSSSWYFREYPQWVVRWNAGRPADAFDGATWNLATDVREYGAVPDDRPFEKLHGSLGRTFPHRLVRNAEDPARFYSALRYTPMADELLLDFAKSLIIEEQVGQRGATDYLSLSFSSTDYIGHAFGPESLESADNLLHLDRTIAELLAFIDRQVGLEHTMIALSSDHGISPAPETAAEMGFTAGRLGMDLLLQEVNERLKARFGVTQDLVRVYLKPWVYLSTENLSAVGLDPAAVEDVASRMLNEHPGIREAVTRDSLLKGGADTPLLRAVQRSVYPGRSGNLFIVVEPYWYISSTADKDAATHGTPYTYDTHVPLIFAGPGIRGQAIYRRVAPRDLAPTLAALLGILPPTGATGNVLYEVQGRASP